MSYSVAQMLEVPLAEGALVWIGEKLLRAAGPALADISPGWAFGSIWIESALPAWGLGGSRASIVNPEAVAGVSVLDSLTGNIDRTIANVLLEPSRGTHGRFRLRFIDQALGLGGGGIGFASADHFQVCIPSSPHLLDLVTRQEQFMPYFLAAEGLRADVLSDVARHILTLGWGLPGDYPEIVVDQLMRGSTEVRSALMASLDRFPKCL